MIINKNNDDYVEKAIELMKKKKCSVCGVNQATVCLLQDKKVVCFLCRDCALKENKHVGKK